MEEESKPELRIGRLCISFLWIAQSVTVSVKKYLVVRDLPIRPGSANNLLSYCANIKIAVDF